MRPLQIWVPDTRARGFAADAARQVGLVATIAERSSISSIGSPTSRQSELRVPQRGYRHHCRSSGQLTGKPRPTVVLQSSHSPTATLTVCPITSIAVDAALLRICCGQIHKLGSSPRL
jgi:hypothetical protein